MQEALGVGDFIDLLYMKRAERLNKQHEVEAMEAEEKVIREKIISMLEEQGLGMGGGGTATASITRRVVASPVDWQAIHTYIKENDAFDLLQKRINDTAYRDRLEQGEVVPGCEPYTVVGLSLVKASRKD
jgi:hypothetical protein